MKLASLKNGTRDGRLVVVSRDLRNAVAADAVAPTMCHAIEHWAEVQPALERLSQQLQAGQAPGAFPFDPAQAMAPLPRTHQFIDGSVFPVHAEILSRAYNMPLHKDEGMPILVPRQGDDFRGPCDDYETPSEDDQIDFEGEFAVITDDVPMGVSAAEAAQHIKLITFFDDVSMRKFVIKEVSLGFGMVRSKCATVFAPVAVTPDELGEDWAQERVHLDLHITRNGEPFGHPNGREMNMSFAEIIAYAAYNRRLRAGFVLGSGTVANEAHATVGSACLAERRALEVIEHGAPRSPFLRFGERVRMEVLDAQGRSVFGALDFKLVPARQRA